jgi:hypothetical protein
LIFWGKKEMDGELDFQADGAAHHQARSQAEASGRKPVSMFIRTIHITIRGASQETQESRDSRGPMISQFVIRNS